MQERTFECCLCGAKCTGWGNNPWPLSNGEDDRCCDYCNWMKVVPARLSLYEAKKQKHNAVQNTK